MRERNAPLQFVGSLTSVLLDPLPASNFDRKKYMRHNDHQNRIFVILSCVATGAVAVVLTMLGNPSNMGLSVACFIRDIAGALGLHAVDALRYVRPEIIGITIGAALAAACAKEFQPRGGSSPMTRFVIGVIVMIGAMVFLGCPLRMLLRIGGGDLNAVVGLAGFTAGIAVGSLWLKSGFTLRRAYAQSMVESLAMPAVMVVLLILSVNLPGLFLFSSSGTGAVHAAPLISLCAGLLVGALLQRSRFCTMASVRNVFLFRDFSMLWGLLALVATVAAGNALLGRLQFSFSNQPAAMQNVLWNFLSMTLVGWGSVFLDGCPLRQLIRTGEGNSDSAITVLGFFAGAAISHNFRIVSLSSGPTQNGMIAIIAGFVVLIVIGMTNRERLQ